VVEKERNVYSHLDTDGTDRCFFGIHHILEKQKELEAILLWCNNNSMHCRNYSLSLDLFFRRNARVDGYGQLA